MPKDSSEHFLRGTFTCTQLQCSDSSEHCLRGTFVLGGGPQLCAVCISYHSSQRVDKRLRWSFACTLAIELFWLSYCQHVFANYSICAYKNRKAS
jgi:hypothetical protein